MKHRIVIPALILFLLVGCFSCANQGGNGLKVLSQNMTVHEFSGSSPDSVAVVYGRAQNVKNVSINHATISVNFYDKNKKLIATGSAVKENLGSGEGWDFSVQTVGPDAWKIVSYDITINAK